VRLLAYVEEGMGYFQFFSWQEYIVDSEGSLDIEIETLDSETPSFAYFAIGEKSGEASEFNAMVHTKAWLTGSLYVGCTNLPVYECHHEDCAVIANLQSNAVVKAIGQPYIDADLSSLPVETWIPIRLSNGTQGWLIDSECLRRLPSSDDNPASGCPGAPMQNVQVGKQAQVCTQSDRLVMRSGPGLKYAKVTMLDPEALINVVDGPRCAGNWSWWKIVTNSGTTGWVAEGGDSVDPYFICPVP
jgi:hypothetical protein